MKKNIIAILVLTAAPAFAQPAPAGQCSLVDNGVATGGPNMKEKGLKGLSMPLPKGIGDAIADISFRIQADGSVTDVKTLCITASDREAALIVNAAKTWRFAPVVRNGKPATADAGYRVSASGVRPLSFDVKAD